MKVRRPKVMRALRRVWLSALGWFALAIAFAVIPRALFKHNGVRILALPPFDPVSREVVAALDLLATYEATRFNRLRRNIRVIVLSNILKSDGKVIAGAGFCILNPERMPPEISSRERILAIAGLLVHEATHGYLFNKHFVATGVEGRRAEVICEQEQDRALDKLECNPFT